MKLPRLSRCVVLRVTLLGVLGLCSAVCCSITLGLLPSFTEYWGTTTNSRAEWDGKELVVRESGALGRRTLTLRKPNPKPPEPLGGSTRDQDTAIGILLYTQNDYAKDVMAWEVQREFPLKPWSPPWWLPAEDRKQPEYAHPAYVENRGYQAWVEFTAVGFPFTMFLDRDSLDTKPPLSQVTPPRQLFPWSERLMVHREYIRAVTSHTISGTPFTYHIEVPLRVVPLGLVANTAAHGLAWWMLFAGLIASRRAMRRRAGKCVKCKYDLTGIDASEPCPECGRVETRRALTKTVSDPAPTAPAA